MASYTIGIDIVADDNATSQINKAESSLLDLDRSQQGVTNTSKQATDAVSKQKSAFGDLTSSVQGLLVGYASLRGLEMVGEMIEQGQAVNTAAATFRNLSGGALEADSNLRMMRESTGGIVSDFTLMSGANRLLLMNLAETGDEASKLTQIAVTLGRAMGHDAGESVEAFAALLANQSIPRLDNFGISSDRVRQRLEELKAAGMGAQEAFSQAVMEQGALALDRLGSATTAAITPVEQLKTTWTNFWDNFDSRLATGINGLIGIAQVAAGTSPQQQAQQAQAQAAGQDFVNTYYDMIAYAMSSETGQEWDRLAGKERAKFAAAINTAFQGLSGLENMSDRTSWGDVLSSLTDIPDSAKYTLVEFVEGAIKDAQTRGEPEAAAAGVSLASSFAAGVKASNANPMSELFRMQGANASGNATFGAMQIMQTQVADFTRGMGASHAMDYWIAYGEYWQVLAQQQADIEMQAAAERGGDILRAGAAAQSQLGSFMSEGAGVGDYAFQEQADAMAAKFEEIKALGEQGLISQDDVEKASDLNDHVQDAAEAMKNLKLPDVFGQGTGGIQGQITDDLIAQMQASGNFKPEDIEAMKQQLDLQSGRETSASVAYQEDVLPLLGDIGKLNPDDMAKAVQNLSAFMELAAQKGLTPDEIARMMPQATGYGYTGQGANPFTVMPGQTPGEIAAMLGVPVEQVLGMTGAANAGAMMPGQYMGGQGVAPIQGFSLESMFGSAGVGGGKDGGAKDDFLDISTSLQDMVQPTQEITDNFTILNSSAATITSNVGQLGADLALLASGTHKISIELDITNLGFINSLIQGQGGSGTAKVRDNGGQVTGTDNRTGPS